MDEKILIPKFIERREPIVHETVIPKIFIQTYKNNRLHPFIHRNILKMLVANRDYQYRFITDEDGEQLIQEHFDETVLTAFKKVKLNAAKGDFLRYIALYVYGGIYLDLDANLGDLHDFFFNYGSPLKLSEKECILFYNDSIDSKIEQWVIMTKPHNEIIRWFIDEMVKRIHDGETYILDATGPHMVTDVIYNRLYGTQYYKIFYNFSLKKKTQFVRSLNYMQNGIFLNRENLKKWIQFNIRGYKKNYIYQDEIKYNPYDNIFCSNTILPVSSDISPVSICKNSLLNQTFTEKFLDELTNQQNNNRVHKNILKLLTEIFKKGKEFQEKLIEINHLLMSQIPIL